MGSWTRAGGCISFCRSWRTMCSCLQSRLMILLVAVYILHLQSSQSQAKYLHTSNTSYTFSCNNDTWCGERWRANRILRYHYNYSTRLEVRNETHVVHENNCTGAKGSDGCSSITTTRNETRPFRVSNLTRSSDPEVVKMPSSYLYLITTDNFNGSSTISETYDKNQDKIWQLHIPDGCKMNVYFQQFDLEVSDRCTKDSFSVQTKKNQMDIYRYCNDLHAIELRRINRVQMTFHANSAIERGGIRATACITNLHDAVSEDELNQALPCTCTPTPKNKRKKKAVSLSKQLRKKIAAEKVKVSAWLHTLMEGGEAMVENFRSSENHKKRHLAELYQDALSKHREW